MCVESGAFRECDNRHLSVLLRLPGIVRQQVGLFLLYRGTVGHMLYNCLT